MWTAEQKQELQALIAHAETRRAACIEAMNWVQRRFGWVSDESLAGLGELLDMSPTELDSVATFYNLIFRRRVGRHVILVCDSISCWICGGDDVFAALQRQLGIAPGETTADGEFTLLPVPCLGVCHRAPCMMIDDELHVNLTAAKIAEILERTRGRPRAVDGEE
jgi:NADH-quinone oxidoreductase subunit E